MMCNDKIVDDARYWNIVHRLRRERPEWTSMRCQDRAFIEWYKGIRG